MAIVSSTTGAPSQVIVSIGNQTSNQQVSFDNAVSFGDSSLDNAFGQEIFIGGSQPTLPQNTLGEAFEDWVATSQVNNIANNLTYNHAVIEGYSNWVNDNTPGPFLDANGNEVSASFIEETNAAINDALLWNNAGSSLLNQTFIGGDGSPLGTGILDLDNFNPVTIIDGDANSTIIIGPDTTTTIDETGSSVVTTTSDNLNDIVGPLPNRPSDPSDIFNDNPLIPTDPGSIVADNLTNDSINLDQVPDDYLGPVIDGNTVVVDGTGGTTVLDPNDTITLPPNTDDESGKEGPGEDFDPDPETKPANDNDAKPNKGAAKKAKEVAVIANLYHSEQFGLTENTSIQIGAGTTLTTDEFDNTTADVYIFWGLSDTYDAQIGAGIQYNFDTGEAIPGVKFNIKKW